MLPMYTIGKGTYPMIPLLPIGVLRISSDKDD